MIAVWLLNPMKKPKKIIKIEKNTLQIKKVRV